MDYERLKEASGRIAIVCGGDPSDGLNAALAIAKANPEVMIIDDAEEYERLKGEVVGMDKNVRSILALGAVLRAESIVNSPSVQRQLIGSTPVRRSGVDSGQSKARTKRNKQARRDRKRNRRG